MSNCCVIPLCRRASTVGAAATLGRATAALAAGTAGIALPATAAMPASAMTPAATVSSTALAVGSAALTRRTLLELPRLGCPAAIAVLVAASLSAAVMRRIKRFCGARLALSLPLSLSATAAATVTPSATSPAFATFALRAVLAAVRWLALRQGRLAVALHAGRGKLLGFIGQVGRRTLLHGGVFVGQGRGGHGFVGARFRAFSAGSGRGGRVVSELSHFGTVATLGGFARLRTREHWLGGQIAFENFLVGHHRLRAVGQQQPHELADNLRIDDLADNLCRFHPRVLAG